VDSLLRKLLASLDVIIQVKILVFVVNEILFLGCYKMCGRRWYRRI